MRKIITVKLFVILTVFVSQEAKSQLSSDHQLYNEIMRYDSLLFEEGFNQCDLEILSKITSEDLEFYHDQSGITCGQKNFINDIENNICSIAYRPKRKLREESSEVYPLQNNGKLYGAIQKGVHEFYAVEENKEPYLTSTARFTHLWLKKDSNWVLQNVLSFDHQAQTAIPDIDEMDLFENISDIEKWLEENHVPALGLAILKNGRLSKVSVHGHLYDDFPAPYHTVFNVASLTKPIISMLTLKLVDMNQWDLDEPVYPYWVDSDVQNDPNHKKLTTRHILSHQSGFKNWRWENESTKLTFDFEPGTDFRYSGEGFEYLKETLEAKFQKPIHLLADSIIFKPIGMRDTKFYWDESVDEKSFARWHDSNGVNVYPTSKTDKPSAADDLLTTVEDYGKFAEYMLTGAGISEKLFTEMVSPQNGKEQNIKMGLGWEILPNLRNDEYALLHTGGDRGVNTLIMLLPKTGEGIVIFTNGDNGKNLFFKLIEENLSLGKQITSSAK